MNVKKTILATSIVISSSFNAIAFDYIVKGQVDGMDGKYLYMKDYDTQATIDTALVSNGSFKFEGCYERPAFVRVDNLERLYSNCVLDSLVVLDFDTHLPSEGAELTQKLLDFVASDKKFEEELDKFGDELRSHGFKQPEFGELYKHLFDKLYPEILNLYKNTICSNPNGIGERAVMSLCHKFSISPSEWDTIYMQMPEYLKDRNIIKRNNDKFTNLKKSMPGQPFIDFKVKTKEVFVLPVVQRRAI